MKSLTRILIPFLLIVAMLSCKAKKKVSDKKFFPVLSFIKSQVAQVDSSLNSIRKYVFIDSLHTDTNYISREQFRSVASDFLTIPDLTDEDFSDRYTESEQFDQTLNRVIVVTMPVKPEKELIQRQEVLIKPDPSGDRVTNIIINTTSSSKDSSIQKNMLWKVDESFTVTTIRQVAGQPETTNTYKVVWNENE